MNKVPYHLIACSDNPPKADGTASSFTNNQEPTEFKIGSNQYKNRTSPPLWTQLETDIPNPSAISRIPLHKFERKLTASKTWTRARKTTKP